MAKKEPEVEEVEKETEAERVVKWRREFFSQVLPKLADEQLERLVVSDASPHKALDLRNRECPDHLIVEILA